jgi:hypothetical protein
MCAVYVDVHSPLPGAVRVLDHDAKTGADARLAFTRPKDQQVQDWVRKLLTQKQKTTDMWRCGDNPPPPLFHPAYAQ